MGAYSRNFNWKRSLSSNASTHSWPWPAHEVPLVHGNHDAAAGLGRLAGNRPLAVARAFHGVDDEHDDVGARHGALGQHDAHGFDLPARRPPGPAAACPAVSSMRSRRFCH